MYLYEVITDAYQRFGLKGGLVFLTHIFLRGGLSSRPWLMKYAGIFHPIFNIIFLLRYGSGTDVMDEDWDNLIILDACRYDDFHSVNSLSGELERRISKGTDSKEFIYKNFCEKELHDTVYITANPHVDYIGENVFHAIVDRPINQWDPDKMCVRPYAVTDTAIEAHEQYPNKRLIIHYMQPHDPPLGSVANELENEIDIIAPVPKRISHEQPGGTRFMHAIAWGDISLEKGREAYRETLDIALEEVERLLEHLDGKSVITADHGEMFGETPYPVLGKLYAHYFHPRTVELCKVPWFHVENEGDRRPISSDPPDSVGRIHSDELRKQLRDLGYT